MANAADRIKANAERFKTAATSTAKIPTATATESPASRQATVRQKTVRRSLDLAPATHRTLERWQSQAADQLGLARVTGQQVLTALVERLLSDEALQAAVLEDIARRNS